MLKRTFCTPPLVYDCSQIRICTFGGQSLHQQDRELGVADEFLHQVDGRFVLQGRYKADWGVFDIFQQHRHHLQTNQTIVYFCWPTFQMPTDNYSGFGHQGPPQINGEQSTGNATPTRTYVLSEKNLWQKPSTDFGLAKKQKKNLDAEFYFTSNSFKECFLCAFVHPRQLVLEAIQWTGTPGRIHSFETKNWTFGFEADRKFSFRMKCIDPPPPRPLPPMSSQTKAE